MLIGQQEEINVQTDSFSVIVRNNIVITTTMGKTPHYHGQALHIYHVLTILPWANTPGGGGGCGEGGGGGCGEGKKMFCFKFINILC